MKPESDDGAGAAAGGGRRVGRPRTSGPSPDAPPRDVIVSVAARLFAEKGYSGTTMTAIARAAGLKQQSLYYWFPRKEQVLQATLAVNRVSLDFIDRLQSVPDSPALKLYRLVRYDTLQLCLSPVDFNEIEQLAAKQPDAFAGFWRDYDRLVRWVVAFIEDGVAQGQLLPVDVELTALGLLTFDEGMQKRFRHRAQHRLDSEIPFRYGEYSAVDYADFAAVTSIRSLLAQPGEVRIIQQQAARYEDSPPPDGRRAEA
ncbi:TetR/AcrR family transcriptional regulator [Streptomyces xiangluensis]|uniref:TetR/AcrR family transcriptional regulator n=1 Tax=Streptomyces xiangluensis TaxID=2665720 RepID=A0ABV8YPI2_9ACTN